MALPGAGNPLSVSQIRSEIQNTGKSNDFSMRFVGGYVSSTYVPMNQSSTSKPNLTSSFSISEWYSYNHTQARACSNVTITTPALGVDGSDGISNANGRIYYKINVTGVAGDIVYFDFGAFNTNNDEGIACEVYPEYPFNSSGTIISIPIFTVIFGSNGSTTEELYLASSSEDFHLVIRIGSLLETGGEAEEDGSYQEN
jgi:hypothetical protein